MLVMVNGASLSRQREVARRIASQLERALVLESASPDRLGSQITANRAGGIESFILPAIFTTWESLRRFRRALGGVEPTSYAYRLQCDVRSSGPEERSLQQTQAREARCGDVGLVVPFESDEQAAAFVVNDLLEPVELVDWEPRFSSLFEKEKTAIEAALSGLAPDVEHVGSTAVEGLRAKPIVDIAVTVPSLEDSCSYVAPLLDLGYSFCDYPENVERYFFRKGRPRTHHLHVGERDSKELEDQLRFRDALRADSELRRRYAELKRRLSESYGRDRALYSEAKGSFVAEALRKATSLPP